MSNREDDYEDKIILLITGRLLRYRILKGFLIALTLPVVLPLVLIAKVGEWSEQIVSVIQSNEFLIRHQIVWRFRWNELAREIHKRKKESDSK